MVEENRDAEGVEVPEQGDGGADKTMSVRDALAAGAKAQDVAPESEPEAKPEGPARDETGKFAAKQEAPEKPADKQVEPAKAAEKPAEKAEAKPQQQTKPATAPKNWSPEARAKWETLPPEVQREIARRESEVDRGFTQKAREFEQDRKMASSVKEALQPFADNLKANGLSEADGVKWLADRYRHAATDPEGYLRWFAQEMGVDLSKLGSAAAGSPEAPQPAVDISRHLSPLQQEIQSLKQTVTSQQKSQAERQLTEWAQSKPYFEQVRPRMAQLWQQGVRDLDEAYNTAVAEVVDPIRNDVQAQQQAEQEARRKEREAEVQKSKVASGSVNGAPMAGASPADAPAKTVRDALHSAFQHAGGRA